MGSIEVYFIHYKEVLSYLFKTLPSKKTLSLPTFLVLRLLRIFLARHERRPGRPKQKIMANIDYKEKVIGPNLLKLPGRAVQMVYFQLINALHR